MPQLAPSGAPTAQTTQENKLFRDRLRERYQPTEFVRVINIDDETFQWQYFPVDGEDVTFDDNGATRVIRGRRSFSSNFSSTMPGNEQLWEIGPGDSEVLLGACADLFIEGLFKRLVAKQKLTGLDVGQAGRSAVKFNWNDGLLQEQMIDKIFLGIEKPSFNEPRPSTAPKAK